MSKPLAPAWVVLLLVPLVACGGETAPQTVSHEASGHGQPSAPIASATVDTGAASASTATPPAADLPPMMPGRVRVPTVGEVACPSMDFEQFIRAFFNSGDLQVRFTARPVHYKVPYYDYHNTEPGDPANPQWETFERDRPMHDRYRYDAHVQAYISDSDWLYPGEVWTGVDANGQHVKNPVTELSVRKVSDTEYVVDTPGRVTTFVRREDCWYLTHDWLLDPFEGCQWPEGCRALREYEAPYYDNEEVP